MDNTEMLPTTHALTGVRALVAHNHRGDVVVTHVPGDPGTAPGMVRLTPRHAGVDLSRATVEVVDGRLRVEVPRIDDGGHGFTLGPISLGGGTAVHVEIEVPAGVAVEATTKLGDVLVQGTGGSTTVRTGAGEVRVERCLTVRAATGAGNLTVGACTGGSATTGTGEVVVDSSEGELHVRAGAGDVRVNASSGGAVSAATGAGDIRVELLSGSAECRSGAGDVTVVVPRGEPVWLDLSAGLGTVRRDVEPVGAPADGQAYLSVKARTGLGDVTVRHP
ncbi:DUF4097 family beta strand repeat-containing protein [Ornithinimicrobium cerasi]|uniref:DUF4097 and DUF4098 domain-containing protein YvlB n=1 Tax=Ornithinimicrobium cerasi TaxID=2248773 RepID=A0A285VQM2_9MICO|nr:DUF4097 family beta strand repeat-containing protein [Ornithinimicrobium cerasi]SOC55878.1 DUF4097 and DUF4098 domain-containing protein YvlB [Ornithinimicrobium cerasi]